MYFKNTFQVQLISIYINFIKEINSNLSLLPLIIMVWYSTSIFDVLVEKLKAKVPVIKMIYVQFLQKLIIILFKCNSNITSI